MVGLIRWVIKYPLIFELKTKDAQNMNISSFNRSQSKTINERYTNSKI
jgi:hypothetical protein